MARSYEDVLGVLRPAGDPVLDKFTHAAQTHLEDAYNQTFALGDAVAARRAELHLSQVQLSERTGIPQADISRIERGKGNPTWATVTKILDALGLRLTVQTAR